MHHTDVAYEFSGEFAQLERQPQAVEGRAVSPRFPEGYNLHSGFLAKYELGAELGAGGNGFVFQARRRSDGQDIAVKFLSTYTDKPSSRRPWVNHRVYGRVPWELWVLGLVRRQTVIDFLDVFKDGSYVYIVCFFHLDHQILGLIMYCRYRSYMGRSGTRFEDWKTIAA
jgi:serine/threonine protein kinase